MSDQIQRVHFNSPRAKRGLEHIWRIITRPMRLFRLLDWLQHLAVSRWNCLRLKAAGARVGPGLVLDGSILVGGGDIVIGSNVHLGEGVYIGTDIRGGRLVIGDNTYIGGRSIIVAYQSVTIGADCLLAPHSYITDVNHGFAKDELIRLQKYDPKPIVISDDVWFGSGVRVMPGVTIGHGAVIGAGAVVTHDIEPNAVAVGVPAKVIKYRT